MKIPKNMGLLGLIMAAGTVGASAQDNDQKFDFLQLQDSKIVKQDTVNRVQYTLDSAIDSKNNTHYFLKAMEQDPKNDQNYRFGPAIQLADYMNKDKKYVQDIIEAMKPEELFDLYMSSIKDYQ